MQKLYFTITNNCNLECNDCCYGAGPRRPSISVEDMKRVIDNLPWTTRSIELSGGEIFTRKKLLYATLEYIQSKKFRKLKRLEIQTNGFWATSERKVNRTIEELISLGVNSLEISSSTVDHVQAGLNFDRPRLLEKIVRQHDIKFFRRPYNPFKASFMSGRGKDVKRKHRGSYSRHIESTNCNKFEELLDINFKGNLYPCCWMVPGTELGDTREERVVKLIAQAKKNDIFSILRGKDGPKKLAKIIGLDKATIEEYSKYGPCTLCSYMFNNDLVRL